MTKEFIAGVNNVVKPTVEVTQTKFGSSVLLHNILRDYFQGKYGNRVPLNSEEVLEVYRLWGKLAKLNPLFGAIEMGGADPQVASVFRNADHTKVMEDVANSCGDCTIRPLWRGANGWTLEPKNNEELAWLITQALANASNGREDSNNKELLRIKAFDSQGIIKELGPTVEIVKKLQNDGKEIGIEIAIPYSNGEGCDPNNVEFNPYPDDLYVNKFIEAAKLLQEQGMSLDKCRISLKDMAGELDGKTAERLVPKIIEALKKQKLEIPFGLHLHNTGLAKDAYVQAIKACKTANWSIGVDIIDCTDGKTGFVGTLELNAALLAEEIDLGINKDQIGIIKEISEKIQTISEKYKLRRVDDAFTGEELRKYKIAGGAFSSFSTAIKDLDLASTLGVSEIEALHIAGNALIAVRKLMGYPFGVTPGFQNTQIAAITLLKNMIEAKYITKEESRDSIIAKILKPLANDQVDKFFLKDIHPTVKEFIRGKMPSEMHRQVEEYVNDKTRGGGQREGLLTDGKISNLKAIKELVVDLFIDNYKQLDETSDDFKEIRGLIVELDKAGLEEVKKIFLEDKDIPEKYQRVVELLCNKVSQGIIVGLADLRDKIEHPWKAEPDASQYTSEKYGECYKDEYERAMVKFKKGLNPQPDKIDTIRQLFLSGKLSIDDADLAIKAEFEIEKLKIKKDVLRYIGSNPEATIKAAASDIKAENSDLTKYIIAFYQNVKEKINKELSDKGRQTLRQEGEYIDIAFKFLREELVKISKNNIESSSVGVLMNKIKSEIEGSEVRMSMPGVIFDIKVKKSDYVKKGDVLCKFRAMKMEHNIIATCDGEIGEINMKLGDQIAIGTKIMSLKQNEIKETKTSKITVSDVLKQSLETQYKKAADGILRTIEGEVKRVDTIMRNAPTHNPKNTTTLTLSQKKGHHRTSLQIKKQTTTKDDCIHIIGNRTGCAAKIYGDLVEGNIHILHTKGDETTPIVKNFDSTKKHRVSGYMNQDEIIATLKNLVTKNPNKTILFHPGWGFLSENPDFVARMEKEFPNKNVKFAGPSSKMMKMAGNKFDFREVVKVTYPEFNPVYFKFTSSLEELAAYINNGYRKDRSLDQYYRAQFDKICEEMGGDVMIKAVSGGGGRGIKNFRFDATKNNEENYKRYLADVLKTRQDAELLFGDDEVMVEARVKGNAHHVEVQFVATSGKAINLGMRNCSAQNDGQKFIELNIIKDDYSDGLIKKINDAADKISQKLATEGYRGLGTLEMIVIPETGEVKILEVNTRLQVEHGVTEKDIQIKTKKDISLPKLNSLLIENKGNLSPQEILQTEFGINEDDLKQAKNPGKQRVAHFRVNSKYLDFKNGKSSPSWFNDKMWHHNEAIEVATKNNTDIMIGGLGDGTCDSQIGSILGLQEDSLKAIEQLAKMFRMSSISERNYNSTTNLDLLPVIYPLLFNKNGTLNKDFSTGTVDRMLRAVADGKITIETTDGETNITTKSLKNAMDYVTAQEQPNQVKKDYEAIQKAYNDNKQKGLSGNYPHMFTHHSADVRSQHIELHTEYDQNRLKNQSSSIFNADEEDKKVSKESPSNTFVSKNNERLKTVEKIK